MDGIPSSGAFTGSDQIMPMFSGDYDPLYDKPYIDRTRQGDTISHMMMNRLTDPQVPVYSGTQHSYRPDQVYKNMAYGLFASPGNAPPSNPSMSMGFYSPESSNSTPLGNPPITMTSATPTMKPNPENKKESFLGNMLTQTGCDSILLLLVVLIVVQWYSISNLQSTVKFLTTWMGSNLTLPKV